MKKFRNKTFAKNLKLNPSGFKIYTPNNFL